MTVSFSATELRDLGAAWLALGVAFTIFFLGGGRAAMGLLAGGREVLFGELLAASLLTAGVAFLLHELAHKVVAVRFGQVAEFRADYGMLFVAVVSSLVGFLFAAPGAVYHYGRPSARENGLIALAGPVVNLLLAAAFVPVWLFGTTFAGPFVELLGARGIGINLFLAAFNLVPYGPLDGQTVMHWSRLVWVVAFVPSAVLAAWAVFVVGLGF